MTAVFLGLGSNLDQPAEQVTRALQALGHMPSTQCVRVSKLYRSKPLGVLAIPDFVNAVAWLETELTPDELLDQLQAIEQAHGRERKAQRWGSRTLDLDILLYGDCVIDTDRLTIPHYDLKNRAFVVYPMLELAPNLVLPDGQPLQAVAQALTADLIEVS